MNIYLIGFMGSGKSFVGKRLAEKYNYQFIDLDDYLESAENQTISEIFNTFGEDYFRNLERQYLKKTSHFERTIFATGGGLPCFFDNIELINRLGTSIFLNPSPTILKKRLLKETAKRPLLAKKSETELEVFISQKLEERRPFYEKANYIIDNEDSFAAISALPIFKDF